MTLLEVRQVTKNYSAQGNFGRNRGQIVKAVDHVSISLAEGETLGVVGESGCGKSTLAKMVAKLLEPTSGSIIFQGQDLAKLSSTDLRKARQNFQIIFQDPYSSLNPRKTVRDILAEPFVVQGIAPEQGVESRVAELLRTVGLDESVASRYPHEFSGGQRQRIGIARALALNPKLIVCDEPVSALDVSIQAQVINLLKELQDKFGIAYLFIAHDLNVVKHIADRVAVMYLGKIVEIGPTSEIYNSPRHPYTKALVSSAPSITAKKRDRIVLQGDLPSPLNPPSGCRFSSRCWKAEEICHKEEPKLVSVGNVDSACHFPL